MKQCAKLGGCGRSYQPDRDHCPWCGTPEAFSSLVTLPITDYSLYTYDIEIYPNVFTLKMTHAASGTKYTFEISDRRNDHQLLVNTLLALKQAGAQMVGYNNIGFDYPVIHKILTAYYPLSAADIYKVAMAIIESHDNFSHLVWESDWVVKQVDLFKIHHFNNKSKSTSLKVLEFNMQMDNIQDLPHPLGTHLNHTQIDELLHYNGHDVVATELFLVESLKAIALRESLSAKYGIDFTHLDLRSDWLM